MDGWTGNGTVFKLNKDGSGYAVLYNFGSQGNDGYLPDAVIEGSDGALYGTTQSDGWTGNGTVFKLNKDGSGYAVLYNFGSQGNDGAYPCAGVVEGSDGALYGTTQWGGRTGNGTVFKLNKDGSGYAVLYNFGSQGNDGANPAAGLVEGPDGALYGTNAWADSWTRLWRQSSS